MFSIASELEATASPIVCTPCRAMGGLRAATEETTPPSKVLVGVVALLLGLVAGYSLGAPAR